MAWDASDLDEEAAFAALEWLLELGVDAAVGDLPVNAYALPETPAPPRSPVGASAGAPDSRNEDATGAGAPLSTAHGPAEGGAGAPPDPVEVARRAAARANSLEDLREAITAYDLCELKKGAKTTVFSDGNPHARVMIIGEAPGRDEDSQGKPFVGRAGQFLDRMFAPIGLSRQSPDAAHALYITNVLPWRPPGNRDPEPAEIAQMLPFLTRHVELADPDLIVLMGNIACVAALGQRGILRLRGHWTEAFDRPALPMAHPAYLLRQPQAKREAWADLLSLRARLAVLPG